MLLLLLMVNLRVRNFKRSDLVLNEEGKMKDRSKYTKPSKEDLKKRLTPLQYRVKQEDGTEPPFDNEYWNNKREGIYVDIVS